MLISTMSWHMWVILKLNMWTNLAQDSLVLNEESYLPHIGIGLRCDRNDKWVADEIILATHKIVFFAYKMKMIFVFMKGEY